MAKLVAFLILIVANFAQAVEVEVRPQIYATDSQNISALELFSSREVPSDLAEILQSNTRSFTIPNNMPLKLAKYKVLQWLRPSLLKYRVVGDKKIVVKVPNEVKVYPFTWRLNKDNLEKRVADRVKKSCDRCEVTLEVLGSLPKLKSFSQWQISVPNDNWRGKVPLQISGEERSHNVDVKITWYDQVVAASKNIGTSDVMGAGALGIERRDVTFYNETYFTKIENALHKRCKRAFRRGEIIPQRDLKKVNIVRHGQPMTAVFNKNQYQISVNVLAKGSGAAGDTIPVMVTKTKKKIMGKIIDKDSVRVQ